VTSDRDLITRIYDPDHDRRRIADLAVIVLQEAVAGDDVSRRIIEQAAMSLCEMVAILASKLDLAEHLPLCATGGLLVNAPMLQQRLMKHLQQEDLQPQLTVVKDPVRGAVELARNMV
jgi:N-acetylglucosamine kinase-like BadF-type ATPase